MNWLIQHLLNNETIVAAGLTFILSIIGAKKIIGKRLNTVFVITKETLDVIQVLSKALRPDADGKIRIEKQELEEIQKEIADLKKALGNEAVLKGT
jgi:hypothetical protein